MNEQELTNTGVNTDEEDFLPEGYAPGDDFFNPESWTGSASADGRTETVQDEGPDEGTNAGEESAPDDSPATGTGEAQDESAAVPPDGESADDSTPDAAQDEPAETPHMLRYQVNHETREVDRNALTDEQIIEALQKSAALDNARQREAYQSAYDEAMTETGDQLTATLWAERQSGYRMPEEPAADNPTAPADPFQNDVQAIQRFRAAYPDAPEKLPQEVWTAYKEGNVSLGEAYLRHELEKARFAAADAAKQTDSIKQENNRLKQNIKNYQRAPVKGVTGGGVNNKPDTVESILQKGFDGDRW